ncbi:MAG TPA: GNAT family N-acetyltransferase [Solirubrobacteraceae bacterium]|jgi:GNAT superfamily N-acetyltransferase
MSALVRDAEAGDAAAVAVLLAELGYPGSEDLAAERLDHFAADPRSRVQVALSGGEVAGLVATHIVPRLDSDLRSCRIVDLVVTEHQRRRGIATALLEAAAAEARRQGATRLDLSSGDGREDAHAFYRSAGFELNARSFFKRLE